MLPKAISFHQLSIKCTAIATKKLLDKHYTYHNPHMKHSSHATKCDLSPARHSVCCYCNQEASRPLNYMTRTEPDWNILQKSIVWENPRINIDNMMHLTTTHNTSTVIWNSPLMINSHHGPNRQSYFWLPELLRTGSGVPTLEMLARLASSEIHTRWWMLLPLKCSKTKYQDLCKIH